MRLCLFNDFVWNLMKKGLICILNHNVAIEFEGTQGTIQYYFRKRDYLKIRNWYESTKNNYVPQDTQELKRSDKMKEWHFKFQFTSIELAEEYAHSNLKNIANVKNIVIFTSIFERSSGCVLAYGRELIRQAEFTLATYSINLKEDVALYFYIEDITPRDYEFCLEFQLITKEGTFLKLAYSRYSLYQSRETTRNKFYLWNHHQQQFDLQENQPKNKPINNKQTLKPLFDVGFIEIEQDLDEIKDINKYLPQLKIIDQECKLPPAVNFNIKKKKEQIIIQPPFKITLESLLIKINNPAQLKRQILANNPFTMSHKELVEFEIKEYNIILDMHNGWKFMNPSRNTLLMELVIQNEQEIYVSSKQTEKLNLGYYEHEGILFVIILVCKVNFRIKQSTQWRKREFIIGWLPLPIDLALKDNKIDMFFVNDHPFPATILTYLSVQSNFTANFVHPLYQKYKSKQDDRRVLMDQLPIGQSGQTQPNRVIKIINSKKIGTQMISSTQIAQRQDHLDAQIESMRKIILQNEKQWKKNRLALIKGRPDLGEQKINQTCQLDIEECVGKILKVKLQIKSLIPETEVPSIYYLPRKLQGCLYFIRQKYEFNCHINETQVKYHIPVSLNCNKSHFSFKINIESVQQFEAIVNSRLVITLHEQDSTMVYCKGTVYIMEVFGLQNVENVSYLKLNTWTPEGQRLFGTVLINSLFQLQKLKENYTKVEEFQLGKQIQKLPMQERLKMRIGNFKGDAQAKSKAVSMLKQRQHIQFVSNVVQRQLLSDGNIIYELGMDSYYILEFTNEDRSENNVFTFHLNCPYAQLVTDEQDFRRISTSLNVEVQNYKFLQFVMKDKNESYYQTTLQFNQSIGLLVKLNVNELRQGLNLKKMQLIIKRNTIQTKRLVLKCTYKEPLIWQVLQSHEILQNTNNETKIQLIQEIALKYKDIVILNENIRYDYKTREIIFSKRGLSTYHLLCIATPNHSKLKKMVQINVHFYPGISMVVEAGQKIKPSLEFQDKFPIQIVRSMAPQVHIPSEVRFNIPTIEPFKQIFFQVLRPVINYPLLITTHDLSGQKLWSYLLKVTANLTSNSQRIGLSQTQNISFTIQCENPYACKSKFTLLSSSKLLKLSDYELQIGRYQFKSVIGSLNEWNFMQSSIFIFMIDHRGNVIQTTQVAIAPKESIIYQKV